MTLEKLGSLLHHCTKAKAFRHGLSLHAVAIKEGIQSDTIVRNHILNFYAKSDYIDSARQLFDEMSDRNLVTWSAMISGYNQSHRTHLALSLFVRMRKFLEPNEFVLSSSLSSCSAIKDLNFGQQIHAQAVKLGQISVSFVLNSVILMYMKCNVSRDAMSILTDADSFSLTLVSYNVAISGLVENDQQGKAIELFNIIRRMGLVPDCFTFAALLGTDEPVYKLSGAMQLQCLMVKLGLDVKAFPGNVLISLYSKFYRMGDSEKVFSSIEEKDAISWNTSVAACCRCEDHSKALCVFREMVMDHNVVPDDFIYAGVLSAAAALSSMRHGKEIHAHLFHTRPGLDVGVGNALINMYAKNGSIGSAYAVFKQMEVHNLVSWNSIIMSSANHGLVANAFSFFEEMIQTGLKPDSVTFLGLLTACSHSGFANKGQDLFNSMSEIYGITPNVEHLCCLVDLLGRAGRVGEAESYASKYSIGDYDAVVLSSLLSACRLHGDVIVAKKVAKRLLELRPATTSPYVLLSNLYASDRKWDGVSGARKLMQASGLKKEAAHSLIEVKGSIEKFVIDDFSHSWEFE